MNMLYSTCGVAEKGTLIQIKNRMQFKNVKKKIADDINHIVDFWNFITEAFVCLLACKILNISSLEEIPDDLPQDEPDKTRFLDNIAEQIVHTIWPTVDMESLMVGGEYAAVEADETQPDNLDDTLPYYERDASLDSTVPFSESDATDPYMDDSIDEDAEMQNIGKDSLSF